MFFHVKSVKIAQTRDADQCHVCFSLHKSMQESDRRSQGDKEKLNHQMEEMAKLQNEVGDREAEAAALRKEVNKLKVSQKHTGEGSGERRRCVRGRLGFDSRACLIGRCIAIAATFCRS